MQAMKPLYLDVIQQLNIDHTLVAYEPTLIGTPPLGIDIESSDIDIACTAENLYEFTSAVTSLYSGHAHFTSEMFQIRDKPAARCFFHFSDWDIELFCQTLPIKAQWGVRHFHVEKRLLGLSPELVTRIIQLKQSGLKTEAAFASILQLSGDPFEAVLKLEQFNDAQLLEIIARV